jgi:hypothetical protein
MGDEQPILAVRLFDCGRCYYWVESGVDPLRGSLRFVSGLAENLNSIFYADSLESQTANGCPVL